MALVRLIFIIGATLLWICFSGAFPAAPYNPNLEYELIGSSGQVGPKSNATVHTSTTVKPIVINSPPPPDLNSKTFAFDPISKSWTLVKKSDPPPAQETLLWNQSNDKWLTQTVPT